MTNLYHYILSLSQPKISNNIISPNSSLQILSKKKIDEIDDEKLKQWIKEYEIMKSAN
jgi:hypothetical protein